MATPDVQEMLRLMEAGQETDAVARLETLLPQSATSATVYVLLGHAYERAGRAADSLAAWQKAAFLIPGSPVPRAALRRLHTAHPELALAEPVMEEAAEQDILKAAGLEPAAHEDDAADAPESTPDIPYTNLDRLIEELESARIVPDPDFEPEDMPEEPEQEETLVSETLARIYAAQQQYQEAAQVYEMLAEQQPSRADEFRARAAELRQRRP